MRHRPNAYVLDIYTLVLAAFVAVSPWLFAIHYEAARLESMICGVLVVAVAIAALTAFAGWQDAQCWRWVSGSFNVRGLSVFRSPPP